MHGNSALTASCLRRFQSEHLRKHFIVAPLIGGEGLRRGTGEGDGSKEGKLRRGVGKRVLVGGGEGKVRGVQALLFLHFKHCA